VRKRVKSTEANLAQGWYLGREGEREGGRKGQEVVVGEG